MPRRILRKGAAVLSLLSLPAVLLAISSGAPAATGAQSSTVTTSSLGDFSPTFVGPAATGCASGCSLMSGPVTTPSTAPLASSTAGAKLRAGSRLARPRALRSPHPRRHVPTSGRPALTTASPVLPSISCQPLGPGCDTISTSSNGATGVKGLNAVDSASLPTNFIGDVEPPDQGLCAGNGYVVESNNIGEMMVFNAALKRQPGAAIPLDKVMGLTSRGWSSGGDPACEFDSSNGGHWFFTEFVSASTEQSGGPFAGCFVAVANTCYEGIAVSQGSSPFGPYNVYFLNANYDPGEPGYPYLLNDFAKISVTGDAFLLFYDEFPLNSSVPGFGGGAFNGAQEFAIDKLALEQGAAVTLANGKPNRAFNVAIENMGLVPTPDGTCTNTSGVACWAAVIPAQPADPGQFDSGHGGSGFMMDTLDFNSFAVLPSTGDNRIAVWDWTGLSNLGSRNCSSCGSIHFGGQLFSGVENYYDPTSPTMLTGSVAPQKAGTIPLGDECGAAGLSTGTHPPKRCPEGGLATNGDFITQVSQAQSQLWGATNTQVNQTFSSEASPELHQGVAYWVVGTSSFDTTGQFNLTDQGYVSPAHEDLDMPAMAGEGTGGNGGAIMTFTLSGNGGPTGADNGGFYPSTAYGRLTSSSSGLSSSVINVADAGQSPQDGFSEYLGYPGPTQPRWGDYSQAIYAPGSGDRIYFANEYIQSPNCSGKAFTLTIGTCSGTRNGFANWGTSVNYVVP
jgi:hypothetical protein